MQIDEQRLRFRDAMASLSAAVNVVTTAGEAGRCGITATAVCSVTDTPPSVMVCINANSAMNPVFQGNGKLCINVLNHEQEIMARHFAGMTGVTMEERFALSGWQQGALGQPVLKGSLASLEGEISQVQTIGTHLVLMNPLMILVKIIKLRWIHILSYDQMVSRKINNQTTRCANSIF
ncbi:4-hydroxyphenylacetate 3-monooxygenase, reductase component, partial [Klebsiella pneumoniae]|uniref:4-hydroxyphenylacetate 3-monooxygenase, reductase component n=1 Tax=Klebsiella pneumoniae TaxID=573 RepID=UPI003D1C5F14